MNRSTRGSKIYLEQTKCFLLWFGTLLPNPLQAYGPRVNDDPFDTSQMFGIDSDHVFIPFDTKGTVVHSESRVPTDEWTKTTGTHLESCVPTEWEKTTHLLVPSILLTSEDWNPSQEVFLRDRDQSREFKEMRTIHSLTSGMTR
jgi:hypothetical protein